MRDVELGGNEILPLPPTAFSPNSPEEPARPPDLMHKTIQWYEALAEPSARQRLALQPEGIEAAASRGGGGLRPWTLDHLL